MDRTWVRRAAIHLIERGHIHVWEYGFSLFLTTIDELAELAEHQRQAK